MHDCTNESPSICATRDTVLTMSMVRIEKIKRTFHGKRPHLFLDMLDGILVGNTALRRDVMWHLWFMVSLLLNWIRSVGTLLKESYSYVLNLNLHVALLLLLAGQAFVRRGFRHGAGDWRAGGSQVGRNVGGWLMHTGPATHHPCEDLSRRRRPFYADMRCIDAPLQYMQKAKIVPEPTGFMHNPAATAAMTSNTSHMCDWCSWDPKDKKRIPTVGDCQGTANAAGVVQRNVCTMSVNGKCPSGMGT